MSDQLLDTRLTQAYRLEATLAEPPDLGETARSLRRIVPLTGGTFFRASSQIETAAPELAWLSQGVFVSAGGRQATGRDLRDLPRRMKPAHHRDPA
jgi:hypothetical protein